MCEKTYRKAIQISSKHNTMENLTSITTMKAIAMMLLRKSESGKQNTIKTNSNTATKIKGVNGVDKNKDKDVQNENEEENENENEKEKENETAIEMLLKGRNGI